MSSRNPENGPESQETMRSRTSTSSHSILRAVVVLGLSILVSGVAAQVVDLSQFAPEPELRKYSVYATDSVYLPQQSGTASGGFFGSGGGIVLRSNVRLRSPYVSVHRDFQLEGVTQKDTTAGGGTNTASRINVDGRFLVQGQTIFKDAVQVQGSLEVSSNDVTFQDTVLARTLVQSGARDAFQSLVQVRDTFKTNSGIQFQGGYAVRMAGGAGTFTGTTPPANFTTAVAYPTPLPQGDPLIRAPSELPGHTIVGYLPPVGVLPPVNAVAGNSKVGSISRPASGLGDTSIKVFDCTRVLGAGSCDGDVLRPGYYGKLVVDDNDVSLLLGEGFYSFDSISLGSGSNLVAVQPEGKRTFVYSKGNVAATASGTFIGPADGVGATGYGTGTGQFLGGTFMLVGGADVTLPNDQFRDNGGGIWATVTAPHGTVWLGSQVEIFGQVFAQRVIGVANIDFGQGAYIPFDPELPVITIDKGLDLTITEAGPSGPDSLGRRYRDTVIAITISTMNSYTVAVDWHLVDGSAMWNRDYGTPGVVVGPQSGTVTIAKGTLGTSVTLRIYDDTVYTGTRKFLLVLDNPVNAKFGSGLPADTIETTILDDELPVPTIGFAVPTRSGPESIGTDSLRVVLSWAGDKDIFVDYVLDTGSTATAGLDFVAPSGTLLIPAGQTSRNFPLTILQDLLDENNEIVRLVLRKPLRAILGDSTLRYTITDDDAPPVLRVDSLVVDEPAKDSLVDSVTIRLSVPSGLAVDVVWRTSDATAIAGTNYRAHAPSSVRIPAGATSVKVPVVILADGRDSDDKFFRIVLTSPVNATFGRDSAVVLIRDIDPEPTVSIDSATVVEPATGSIPAIFDVGLSAPSDKRVSVRWSTTDITATAGSDYLAGSDSVVFLPGETQKTIAVQILSDNISGEGTETFRVALAAPTNATVSGGIGIGAIREGNGEPILTFSGAATFVESDTLVSFHIHLSNPSARSITVQWRTIGGTATPDLDFQDSSGTIVFAPGRMDTTFQVRIIDDMIRETSPEAFQVRLTGDTNVVVLQPLVTDTILDDFDNPDLAIEDAPYVVEGGSAVFRVTLGNPSTDIIRVFWKTVNGSALAPDDFEGTVLDTLLFLPGQTSLELSIPTFLDSLWEPQENFAVHLLGSEGAIMVDSVGSVWILEKGPVPTLSWRTADTSVLESVGSVVLVAELSRPASVPLSFEVLAAAGTASLPQDASLRTGLVEFPAGSRLASTDLLVVDDTLDEFDEWLEVSLVEAPGVEIVAGDPLRVTILDDDLPSVVSFSDDTLRRPEDFGRVTFTLSLSRPSAKDITVWIAHEGTATDGLDHDLVAGSRIRVFFPAGSVTGTFSLRILDDTLDEVDETVDFRIDSIVNGTAGEGSTLLILDDDVPDVVITRPEDSLRTKEPDHEIGWTWGGVEQPRKDTTLSEGWNRISRCATDLNGNVRCDTVHVFADFTPPRVDIRVPDSLHLTNDPHVRVCWLVVDSGATWRRVDSACMDTLLKEGVHPIPRTACDDLGNCGTDQVIVTVDLTPPTGVFVFPPDSARIRVVDQPAKIRWIDDGDTIWVDTTLRMSHYGWNTFTASYRDAAGNVGTTSITLYFESPQVELGWTVDTDGDGRVDAIVVQFDAPWESDSLPTFGFSLGGETRTGVTPDGWYSSGTRGTPWTDSTGRVILDGSGDTVFLRAGIPMLDKDGMPVIDSATGKVLTSPVGSVWRDASGEPVYDASGREMYRVPSAGTEDRSRMVVPLADPFAFGSTSTSASDTGRLVVVLPVQDSGSTTTPKSIEQVFPLQDSVAAVILEAVVHRTESYEERDTLFLTPSEPVHLDSSGRWIEIKVGDRWVQVDPDSVFQAEDGRIWFLIEPGNDGSPRPGVEVRFLEGVTDTTGNGSDPKTSTWETLVTGPPRPPLLELELPTPVKSVPAEESRVVRPGGFVIRATDRQSGSDTAGYSWWKPGYGYTSPSDPDIASVCPDLRYCNGVEMYINRPVRLVLFVYDLSGTYVVNQEINITQADIDGLRSDRLDRVRIQLQWNMRSKAGFVVGSGIYLWRIVSYVSQANGTMPIMGNQVVKVGVKSTLD